MARAVQSATMHNRAAAESLSPPAPGRLCAAVFAPEQTKPLLKATHRRQHRSAPEDFFPPLGPRSHQDGCLSVNTFSPLQWSLQSADSSSHRHLVGFWLQKALCNERYLTSAVKRCLKRMFLSMGSLSLSHTHTNPTDRDGKQLFLKRVIAS